MTGIWYGRNRTRVGKSCLMTPGAHMDATGVVTKNGEVQTESDPTQNVILLIQDPSSSSIYRKCLSGIHGCRNYAQHQEFRNVDEVIKLERRKKSRCFKGVWAWLFEFTFPWQGYQSYPPGQPSCPQFCPLTTHQSPATWFGRSFNSWLKQIAEFVG